MRVVGLILLLSVFPLTANTVVVPERQIVNVMSSGMIYLAEKDKVKNPENITEWKKIENIPNVLTTQEEAWIKLELSNPNQHSQEVILFAQLAPLAELKVYDGGTVSITGASTSWKQKPIQHRYPAVSVLLEKNSQKTIFMRLRGNVPYNVETTALAVAEESFFSERSAGDNILFGISFGFMAMMVFYNLFYYLFLRRKVFLYYSIYLISFILFMMHYNGYANGLYFRENPIAEVRILYVAFLLFPMFGMMFSRGYLDTKKLTPRFDYALKILVKAFFLVLLLFPFVPLVILATLIRMMAALPILLQVPAAFISLRKKNPLAWFYLASFLPLFAIGGGRIFESFGLMHGASSFNYLLQAAGMFETMILSLGLTFQSYQLQKAKEKTERELKFINDDLILGQRIQNALLPARGIALDYVRSEHAYLPTHHIGSSYLFYRTDKKGTGIILSDVSGHGVAGALYNSMLHMVFLHSELPLEHPALLLGSVQNQLTKKLEDNTLSVGYLWIDESGKTFHFSGAGFLAVYLFFERESRVDKIISESPAIGRGSGEFSELSGKVEKGMRILMLTRGLMDLLSEDQISEFMRETQHSSLTDVKKQLENKVLDERKEHSEREDIAFVILEV